MGRDRYQVAAVVLLVILFVDLTVAIGLHRAQRTIEGSGTFLCINVDAFWDVGCTQRVEAINWGTLWPGNVTSVYFYVKNVGNVDQTLSMYVVNWDPPVIEGPMTLSWDAEGELLPAGDIRYVNVTLAVCTNILGVTDFSMDVVVEASTLPLSPG